MEKRARRDLRGGIVTPRQDLKDVYGGETCRSSKTSDSFRGRRMKEPKGDGIPTGIGRLNLSRQNVLMYKFCVSTVDDNVDASLPFRENL